MREAPIPEVSGPRFGPAFCWGWGYTSTRFTALPFLAWTSQHRAPSKPALALQYSVWGSWWFPQWCTRQAHPPQLSSICDRRAGAQCYWGQDYSIYALLPIPRIFLVSIGIRSSICCTFRSLTFILESSFWKYLNYLYFIKRKLIELTRNYKRIKEYIDSDRSLRAEGILWRN